MIKVVGFDVFKFNELYMKHLIWSIKYSNYFINSYIIGITLQNYFHFNGSWRVWLWILTLWCSDQIESILVTISWNTVFFIRCWNEGWLYFIFCLGNLLWCWYFNPSFWTHVYSESLYIKMLFKQYILVFNMYYYKSMYNN